MSHTSLSLTRAAWLLLAGLSLTACELVADFDRDKIGAEQPLPSLPVGMVPGERPQQDAGQPDAATGDASVDDDAGEPLEPDSGTPDSDAGELPDADGGTSDASVTDAAT